MLQVLAQMYEMLQVLAQSSIERNAQHSGSIERNAQRSGSIERNAQRSSSIERNAISIDSSRKILFTLTFEEIQEELIDHDRALLDNRGDGNCFYMSFSHQLHGTNKILGAIRQAAVKELIENRLRYEDYFDEETLDQYARKQSLQGEYADVRIYLPTCRALNTNLRVHLGAGKKEITHIGSNQWVEIAQVNRNHYVRAI
ncbi:MAG: hypothetical protein EZS28_031191 [Streblomastix strix]|uniref:OTU domain-containing protein n=1 Tax=Streblomastix strix TaxID=222440 RepID=A0A5J4UTI7_9EUKA|nr:MAG: hypothetical protein EZS28_031191 [Streblomastix strix]